MFCFIVSDERDKTQGTPRHGPGTEKGKEHLFRRTPKNSTTNGFK